LVKLKTVKNGVRVFKERISAKRTTADRYGYIGANNTKNLGDDAVQVAANVYFPNLLDFKYPIEKPLSRVGLSGKNYFKGIILGGGTLISRCPGIFDHINAALDLNIPLFAFGTGVGNSGFDEELNSDVSYFSPALKRFIAVGVRGPRSHNLLTEWGIGTSEVVGDTALSLTLSVPSPLSSSTKIALSVALPSGLSDEKYEKSLESLGIVIKKLVGSGYQILPVAMVAADSKAIISVTEGLNIDHSSILTPSTVEQFFDAVSECRFVIGVRLHAAILASCIGVPAILLGYRDKCTDFMQTMQREDLLLDFDNLKADELMDRVEYTENNRKKLGMEIHAKAAFWKDVQSAFVRRMLSSIASS
jgi:polysaccharide pyruvyl transferase WcaK-like protein